MRVSWWVQEFWKQKTGSAGVLYLDYLNFAQKIGGAPPPPPRHTHTRPAPPIPQTRYWFW